MFSAKLLYAFVRKLQIFNVKFIFTKKIRDINTDAMLNSETRLER